MIIEWVDLTQIAGVLIAIGALVVSLAARRDARAKAADIEGGMHSIAYREHVWFLHNAGLTIEEIESVLRRETFRPGVRLSDANAYDNGYAPEVGSVREILDPLAQRQLQSDGTA